MFFISLTRTNIPSIKRDLFQPAIRVPSRQLSPRSLTIYYSEKMETASHILSIVVPLAGKHTSRTVVRLFPNMHKIFFPRLIATDSHYSQRIIFPYSQIMPAPPLHTPVGYADTSTFVPQAFSLLLQSPSSCSRYSLRSD